MFKRIDHVALVVSDLDEAIELYQRTFQVEFTIRERNEEQGFEVATFEVGDQHIELLLPTRPDSVIAGFLEKRGPDLHHLALEVEHLSQIADQLKASGLHMTSNTPRLGTGGSRIHFIHPKSLFGALVELVELPRKDQRDETGESLQET